MLQAAILDGDFFDPFPFFKNGLCFFEVDSSRRHIVQALMKAFVVIVFDKDGYLFLKLSRQVVIVQQNSVFQRLMPALDLPLCLGMIGRAADMLDFLSSSHSDRSPEI